MSRPRISDETDPYAEYGLEDIDLEYFSAINDWEEEESTYLAEIERQHNLDELVRQFNCPFQTIS